MLYSHAGVLSGNSEQLIDGLVIHNNPVGIRASWDGSDPESGITEYKVAIGTSVGERL